MYQYYVAAITSVGYVSFVYTLDFEMNTAENIKKVSDMIEESGNSNPVILFFTQISGQ